MKRTLRYIESGRSGHVVYRDHISELTFWYELGGGNCVAFIAIPSKQDWVNETNRDLAEREPILAFIAEQVIKDKAPHCRVAITGSWINILE